MHVTSKAGSCKVFILSMHHAVFQRSFRKGEIEADRIPEAHFRLCMHSMQYKIKYTDSIF